MPQIVYRTIGEIRTPYQHPENMPIQPAGAAETQGQVVVDEEFAQGLADLHGFSHIILIYHFHGSKGFSLTVRPFLDNREHGLFATRAPRRPNPIGLSVVALEQVEGNVLHVRGIDLLDHTPLLDIKPFVPAFDSPEATKTGWLEGKVKGLKDKRSDDRFSRT